ncbi:ABC transporter ATP-binding protein [Kitasatospora sp. NE20-6]|uniref:ATP-binding cassette domain-containing protein n=1 Tax=Kitasatospora sp. NE20-6 TaxID=2859066 RepID=UPI0034DC0C79
MPPATTGTTGTTGPADTTGRPGTTGTAGTADAAGTAGAGAADRPAAGKPAATPGRAAARLLRTALADSRRAALRLALWTLLSAAPALVSGKALALAVDRGFLVHRPGPAALWLSVFAAVTLLGAWASRQTYPWLAEIVEPLRDRLMRAVVTGTLHRAVAARGRRDGSAAVVVAQLTRQVEAVRDAAAGQLLVVSHFALTAVVVVAGTAALAPAAVPLVAGPLLGSLVAFAALAPATVRRQRQAFLAEEELARLSVDTLQALRDLVACGAQGRAEHELVAAVAENAAAGRALALVAGVRRLVVAAGAHLPLLLVVLAAPALVRRGMTAGEVVGVLAYVTGTLEPALRLLVQGVGASWLRMAVAAERLAGAARLPEPPARPADGPEAESQDADGQEADGREADGPDADADGREARPADGSVVLAGVTFAYGAAPEPVLDALDLALADGEHLAVVGPSGIGKSTLADVLCGIVPPGRGRVLLGGVPPGAVPEAVLARARVLLPQDAYVFAGPLGENLRWLAPDSSAAAVAAAAAALGADGLLARVGGLDGHVEPAALSAGERQLVALVRAYLSPARLVVLDEATRHLDAAAELRVEQAFRGRPGTVVTVTHRPGPARRADRVLLLDGAAPQLGTHAQLLAAVPAYADLHGGPDDDGPDHDGLDLHGGPDHDADHGGGPDDDDGPGAVRRPADVVNSPGGSSDR